jgi:predicted NUDIX family phosphoesterase
VSHRGPSYLSCATFHHARFLNPSIFLIENGVIPRETPPLMTDEMILVVRRSLFEQLGAFQGLNFDVEHYLPALLARENNFFTPRPAAENNPGLKQIIPYALLVHNGRVLHYVRGKKAGEQRLAAKGSLGIGGHLNNGETKDLFHAENTNYQTDVLQDSWDMGAYLEGVRREVTEELNLQTQFTNHIVALLNDDSNAVGQVHLGVVHIFKLETDQVTKREQMITQLEFLAPEQLRARHDHLESWSQICVDHLDRLLEKI